MSRDSRTSDQQVSKKKKRKKKHRNRYIWQMDSRQRGGEKCASTATSSMTRPLQRQWVILDAALTWWNDEAEEQESCVYWWCVSQSGRFETFPCPTGVQGIQWICRYWVSLCFKLQIKHLTYKAIIGFMARKIVSVASDIDIICQSQLSHCHCHNCFL